MYSINSTLSSLQFSLIETENPILNLNLQKTKKMGELKETEVYEEELIDYEEEDEKALDSAKPTTETVKKLVSFRSYVI